jgi:hypothetical protein
MVGGQRARKIWWNAGLIRRPRYLEVINGSKVLRVDVERLFGELVELQRCQIHKRWNVKEN